MSQCVFCFFNPINLLYMPTESRGAVGSAKVRMSVHPHLRLVARTSACATDDYALVDFVFLSPPLTLVEVIKVTSWLTNLLFMRYFVYACDHSLSPQASLPKRVLITNVRERTKMFVPAGQWSSDCDS